MNSGLMEKFEEEIDAFDKHLGTTKGVSDKLAGAIKGLFNTHRDAFVKMKTENYLGIPADFLANRKENETVEDYYKRKMKFPKVDDPSPEAKKLRGQIYDAVRYFEPAVIWLTTHPDLRSNKVEGFWASKSERDDWLDNAGKRKPFKVKLKDDAQSIAKKQAGRDADELLRIFISKTLTKVLPFLKQNPLYFCHLSNGHFLAGAIEGDVRVTFANTKSFLCHVALKYNHSVNNLPFVQYPLTFHDVFAGEGTQPVKVMAQEDLEKLFEIEDKHRWSPPVPESKRYRRNPDKAKPGDIVKIEGKKQLCLITGKDKKKPGNLVVLRSDGKKSSIGLDKIEIIRYKMEIVQSPQDDKKLWCFILLNNDKTMEEVAQKTFFSVKDNKDLDKIEAEKPGRAKIEGRAMAYNVLCKKEWPTAVLVPA